MEDHMKVKKLSKQLTLNKQTIAHLESGEMKDARGGKNSDPTKCRIRTCRECTLFDC